MKLWSGRQPVSPDRLVLDLGEGADFPECIHTALLSRQMFFGII